MVPGAGEILQGVAYGSRAAGRGKSPHAAFKGRHPLFQRILRGIGQTAVNVAGVGQVEPGLGMGTVVKHVGGRLINGHGSRTACSVRLLLPGMHLQGFKPQAFFMIHCDSPLRQAALLLAL